MKGKWLWWPIMRLSCVYVYVMFIFNIRLQDMIDIYEKKLISNYLAFHEIISLNLDINKFIWHWWLFRFALLHRFMSLVLISWKLFHCSIYFPFTQVRSFWVFQCTFQSHLTWVQSHLACSHPCENNIFNLTWKNSQNSLEASPFPLVRYLYESPTTHHVNGTLVTKCGKVLITISSIKKPLSWRPAIHDPIPLFHHEKQSRDLDQLVACVLIIEGPSF